MLRHTIPGKPSKGIAHAVLSAFIAVKAGHIGIHAGGLDAGDAGAGLSIEHIIGRGTDHRYHIPYGSCTTANNTGMAVHDRRAHRRTGSKAQLLSHLFGQIAGNIAQANHFAHQLFGQLLRLGISGLKIFRGRIAGIDTVVAVTAGQGDAAGHLPRQHPNDPVRSLENIVGGGKNLRILHRGLHSLGQEQLTADPAAIVIQPAFAPLFGHRLQPGSFFQCAVVLPKLHPGMGTVLEFRLQAQRHTLIIRKQHRSGCDIQADANHLLRRDPLHNTMDNIFQAIQKILGMLQGKPLRQNGAAGQCLGDDTVGIFINTGSRLRAGFQIQQQRPNGQCAIVKTQCVFFHIWSSCM